LYGGLVKRPLLVTCACVTPFAVCDSRQGGAGRRKERGETGQGFMKIKSLIL